MVRKGSSKQSQALSTAVKGVFQSEGEGAVLTLVKQSSDDDVRLYWASATTIGRRQRLECS